MFIEQMVSEKDFYITDSEKSELKYLSGLSCEQLESIVGIRHRWHFPDLVQVGSHTSLILHEQGIHLIEPGWDCLKSVTRVIYIVRKTNLALKAIFLTHSHIDHYYNLKYYYYLAELEPENFGFTLLSHDINAHFAHNNRFSGFCRDEEFLELDGRKYVILKTPGHSQTKDHIAVFDLNHRLLFTGDILQPQGESYEQGNFVTPVSNHSDPEQAYQSILLLKSLPFEYVQSGHGQFLDMSRGYRWMEITQKTIERTAYYCRKIIWENKNADFLEIAQKVYFLIAIERNLPIEPLTKRLEDDFGGLGQTSFELLDLPSIAYFLRKFGTW